MRTIKFRAWDKEFRKMFPSFGLDSNLCGPMGTISLNGMSRFELMQFTGLTDKNGKEIYEGDILKDNHAKEVVIKWFNSNAEFIAVDIEEYPKDEPTYQTDNVWKNMEVIGNIYENPDLLK